MFVRGSACISRLTIAFVSGNRRHVMRVTICELPHEAEALACAWDALCAHTRREGSELVLLPEFVMLEPLWESEWVDLARWQRAESASMAWMARLPELGARFVVGTRPVSAAGRRLNQGFLTSLEEGQIPLRSKYYLPNEAGGWEGRWFDRGDAEFSVYRAGSASFGLNICTELWALESYSRYSKLGIDAVLAPRATSSATTSKWLSVGVVAAVRAGAYCISSNRVDASGAYGGAGWIIAPDGELMALTSPSCPFATVEIDLKASERARRSYPRYVFA